MSEITINGLLQEAGPIKDATNDNENTALKVGNMFIHIIQYLLKYQNHIESGGSSSSDDLGQLTPINLGLILADLNDLNSYPENNDLVLVWNHTSNNGWDFLPYGGGSQVPGLLGTGDVTWQQLGSAPEPDTQQIDLGHLNLSAYTKNTDSWWGNTPSTLENGTHVVTGSLQGGIQFIRFNRSVTSGGTTANYEVYLGLDENGDLRLSHTSEGNGTASFYATGGVSALGNSSSGSGSGSGGEGQSTPLNKLLTDLNSLNQSFGDSGKYYTIKKDGSSGWILELDSLSKLNDVSYNGTPSNGQYLVYNNGNWTNASASPSSGSGISIAILNSALSWNTETTLATLTTGGSTYSIKAKLPSLPTDEKVKLNYTNTNANYPILFSQTANQSQGSISSVTGEVNKSDNKLYYNPSTETLTVLNISGNATSATNDSANHKITDHYVHSITTSSNTLTYKDGDGDSLGTASLVNSISNTWTAGTTAGPTIQTTVNGVAGTAVAIPSASASASGIVTTGTQTFAGSKTFSSKIIGNLQGNADTATKLADTSTKTIWGQTYWSGGQPQNVQGDLIVKPNPSTSTTVNTVSFMLDTRNVTGGNPESNSVLRMLGKNIIDVNTNNSGKKTVDITFGGENTADKFDQVRIHSKEGIYMPNAISYSSGLVIGGMPNDVRPVLYWDSRNNALALQMSDGSAANFYATGGVSALGLSNGTSSIDAMTFGNLTVNNTLNAGEIYLNDTIYAENNDIDSVGTLYAQSVDTQSLDTQSINTSSITIGDGGVSITNILLVSSSNKLKFIIGGNNYYVSYTNS